MTSQKPLRSNLDSQAIIFLQVFRKSFKEVQFAITPSFRRDDQVLPYTKGEEWGEDEDWGGEDEWGEDDDWGGGDNGAEDN